MIGHGHVHLVMDLKFGPMRWIEAHGMTTIRLGQMRLAEMMNHYAVVPL